MRKPLFITLATGATLLTGGVAVAMAGEPVSNTPRAAVAQPASPTDEPSITPTTPTARPSVRAAITRDQAEAIALRRVGGGQIESTELELEDGRFVWDVDVIRHGVKWEVEIDSRTGQVVEFKSDPARDNRQNRRDDHANDRGDDDHGDHHGDDNDHDNSGPGSESDSDNSGSGGSGDDDNSGPGSHGSDD